MRKQAGFSPQQVARKYPWKSGPDSNLDTFDLETGVGKERYAPLSPEAQIRDYEAFHELISGLSNNKAPGPDGINNELLKHLPECMKETIHKLFILMWLTGTMPDAWKNSNTILLYKKNSELLLENYRPIALANTLYKLWTSLIQNGMSKYAEHFDILSSSQEGFRQERNTMRQLHTVTNMLSDAKITEQDLYMLYIDFSSAFNTIDHDKLLQIMYDLGFRTDAINVIADLYTNATTRIKLPMGYTDFVKILRGTIQEDTLSPLIFLIFIEPLLRWLQSGGKGYKYGMPSKRAKWAGMKVNCKKCGVTGMLYRQAKDKKVENLLGNDTIRMLKIQLNAVKMQGETVPFHHPHTQPYTYLGVEMTPTMNWSYQLEKMLKEVESRGDKLRDSMLSYRQSVHFIRTVIVPAATYAFPLAYLTPPDIGKLDRICARTCKRTLGVPTATPTCMVFEDKQKGGAGSTSLSKDYAKHTAESLVQALLDPGQLGFVSQALLHLQYNIVGDAMRSEQAKVALRQVNHYHLVKKLAIIQQAGLKLTLPQEEQTLTGNSLCEQLNAMVLEGVDLGEAAAIPYGLYIPLLELGYNSFATLLTADTQPTMISTKELAQKHGTKVNIRHKAALNKLTILVNSNVLDKRAVTVANEYKKTGPLEKVRRRINWTEHEHMLHLTALH